MDQLSTQIGALELSHVVAGFDDAVLEATVCSSAPPTPHNAPFTRPCAGDGALEALANPPNHTLRRLPSGFCY